MSLHIEQASSILRNTQDGDTLEPSDLALVQAVVNGGPGALSSQGRIHWDQLIQRTADGTYNRQWFYGIEHLTRDHSGYVSWKGRQVEHYSYPADCKQEEMEAARRLAAICLRVESLGQEVSWNRANEMFNQLDFGEGLTLPRFAVLWQLRQEGPFVKVCLMGEASWALYEPHLAEVVSQAQAEWGVTASHGIRVQTVVTREDLLSVLNVMQTDKQWAQRIWIGCASKLHTLSDQVTAVIDAESLVTRAEVEAQLLGPHLARLNIGPSPDGASCDFQGEASDSRQIERAAARH